MNLKEIKELIEMIRGSDISEIEVEREGSRIRIQLGQKPIVSQGVVPSPPGAAPGAETPAVAAGPVEAALPELVPGQVVIASPMVGTFYRSPSPELPPFIEVGSSVEPGQTVCIIEAMKIMNEIEAERKGRVLRILKEDKDPVEYGEPLFILEPLS